MLDTNGRGGSFVSVGIASTYIVAVAGIAQLVSSIVKEPYLDEIFHIPQAQQYCRGEYRRYDPKLTTPPGLYTVSIALAYVRTALAHILPGLSAGQACLAVSDLRLTTLLFLLLLPWIISDYSEALSIGRHVINPITKIADVRLHHGSTAIASPLDALTRAESDPEGAARRARASIAARETEIKAVRRAGLAGIVLRTLDSLTSTINVHTIAILPPMWFFGFLYYTDIPSTAVVISMLAAAKRQQRVKAVILAMFSLTLRQTNIVWVIFAIGSAVLDRLGEVGLKVEAVTTTGCKEQLWSISNISITSTVQILALEILPYTPLFAASIAFLYVNGSIVLGDRDNHKVSPHLAQPFYFSAFITAFAWPTLLHALRRVEFKKLHLSIVVAICTSAALAAVKYGTVVHPFLLADNRHYAFYVWRKVIGRTSWTRYALVTVYGVATSLVLAALALHRSVFWIAGFTLCLSAALIPSPLIEPRYFMIPYIILRLSISPTEQATHQAKAWFNTACGIEAAWAIFVNAATLYLFLFRPFRWPDSDDWQRFLW